MLCHFTHVSWDDFHVLCVSIVLCDGIDIFVDDISVYFFCDLGERVFIISMWHDSSFFGSVIADFDDCNRRIKVALRRVWEQILYWR